MHKKPVILILSLILLISFADKAFSQTEQITITTYYPAPYGVYRVLRTDILQMGQAAGVVQFVDLAMAQAVGVNPTANAFQFGSFGLDPAGNLSGDGDDDVGLFTGLHGNRDIILHAGTGRVYTRGLYLEAPAYRTQGNIYLRIWHNP